MSGPKLSFLATHIKRDGGFSDTRDRFLGDRFWGQVQVPSGRLKGLRGGGAASLGAGVNPLEYGGVPRWPSIYDGKAAIDRAAG